MKGVVTASTSLPEQMGTHLQVLTLRTIWALTGPVALPFAAHTHPQRPASLQNNVALARDWLCRDSTSHDQYEYSAACISTLQHSPHTRTQPTLLFCLPLHPPCPSSLAYAIAAARLPYDTTSFPEITMYADMMRKMRSAISTTPASSSAMLSHRAPDWIDSVPPAGLLETLAATDRPYSAHVQDTRERHACFAQIGLLSFQGARQSAQPAMGKAQTSANLRCVTPVPPKQQISPRSLRNWDRTNRDNPVQRTAQAGEDPSQSPSRPS